jgi:hypothetical protein
MRDISKGVDNTLQPPKNYTKEYLCYYSNETLAFAGKSYIDSRKNTAAANPFSETHFPKPYHFLPTHLWIWTPQLMLYLGTVIYG